MRWPDAPFWQRRRTPVTLDPQAGIEGVAPVAAGAFRTGVHLPERRWRQLHGSCRSGLRVHEVVRTFTGAHPAVPDQQAILGFQELVERGWVSVGDAASEPATSAV